MTAFDAVIVGAGHNSLTLAAYMARSGFKVGVFERNAWIGGGCTTEEPIQPGFRCNLHSNFYIGFSQNPMMRDLELARFGFSTIAPPVQHGVTLRDGTALTIHTDIAKTCASIARFSRRDAEAFHDLHMTYAVKMRPLFTSMLFNAPLPPDDMRQRVTGPQAKDLFAHASLDLFEAVDRHFEDHRIRTLFKLLMHVTTGENAPNNGMMMPVIMSALSDNALPVGGSASFTNALTRVVEDCGGKVITGADVREIIVAGGRATGVRLADNSRIDAKVFVASGIDAPATMRMTGEEHFPAGVREKLNGWHWGNHSLVTLHLALNAPPIYSSQDFDPDMSRAFNVIFGFDDTDQVMRCFEQCRRGEFPDHLMGNGACNSQFDPTYAPTGKHVAFWWPFAPYGLADGPEEWERRRKEYAARVLDAWRGFAVNLDERNILGSFLYTPRDIPLHNANMVNGAVRMGAYIPAQLGINRPHPLLAGYRTPIEALYLCGSSNHGGGANGAPGYNAANAIADDLKLDRFWTPIPKPEWHG
ncbi:MAG: NAD(P)/FAD-dependent oxidoreductase [Xanthobacteraceae bacterium]